MAVWSESQLDRLRNNSDEVRSLARRILKRSDQPHSLTEWEREIFLPDIAGMWWNNCYTDGQIEKLLEINFLSQPFEIWEGMGTIQALEVCLMARLDLDYDDESWVLELSVRSPRVIYGREVRKLVAITRSLLGEV